MRTKNQQTDLEITIGAEPRGGVLLLKLLEELTTLARLANDKPPASPPPSSIGKGPDAVHDEGSGLTDIRSMANAYRGNTGKAKPTASSATDTIDDLPVFNNGGFSTPAAMVPTTRASNHKMMMVLVAAIVLMVVAAVIVMLVMLGNGNK